MTGELNDSQRFQVEEARDCLGTWDMADPGGVSRESVLAGQARNLLAIIDQAFPAGLEGAIPLAPPSPGDPAGSAYLARRASCRRCGEPGLVPDPAVLGMWLSDRQGTGRGLCPDGETMHQAGDITEGSSDE